MKALLGRYIESNSKRVDLLLGKLFRRRASEPETIRKAMSYSIFAGGKRLRPVLVIAAAECCGAQARSVLKTAAALEMIHTYSLIHDDLPAMDDDDLRRGKPTNHKIFGEAIAILAGDGLLTYAFETAAANAAELGLSAQASCELVRVIAEGAGTRGMVGGQVADLEAENWRPGHKASSIPAASRRAAGTARRSNSLLAVNHVPHPEKTLEYIHLHKTAALITASLEAGAILAEAPAPERRALRAYGRAIGLAFQIADDILDVVGDKKKLGKKGSDAQNNKLTYATLYGIESARNKSGALIALAHKELACFGPKARFLHALADYIIARDK